MIVHQIGNSFGNYNYNAYIYNDIIWEPHFHSNYELIYVIEGETTISINGVCDTLVKGELILISPHTVHSLTIDKSSKTWVGVFSEDFILDFAEKNRSMSYSKFKCDKKIEKILNENLFFQGKPEHYMLTACLYMMCSECIKNAVSCNIKHSYEFMHKVIQYISENLSEDITLNDISKTLNYEYHYFSSLFHNCFGTNFKSFINLFRFQKACKLLMNKGIDITAVCSQCGFGSIRNFNRVFKQLSGLTPSEYRNMIKAKG